MEKQQLPRRLLLMANDHAQTRFSPNLENILPAAENLMVRFSLGGVTHKLT
jgi:hypothetical protein